MYRSNFPPFKADLKKHFGYLSFNCTLINLDLVGIRFIKSGEVVVITYRGNRKTGFIYEGEVFNEKQVLRAYRDAPDSWNDLKEYEEAFEGKVEVLAPVKDNYVFINDMEVRPNQPLKNVKL
ncbi:MULTISPECIES: hypothetical protein [unclassified Chryseobacterium]|uniref:hypothetical protein n=1 Tax=unclassified Chryseobacterium TaxID=2593645 RepID=UPI00301AD4DE